MKVSSPRKIMTKLYHPLLLTILALALLSDNGWAYGDGSGGRRGGPPQEAIDACVGKSAGATVEFKSPRGDTVKGTCAERRGQLVAVPEGKGQGKRGKLR